MKSSAPNPSSLKQVFIPRSIETRTLVHPATVRLEVRERAVEALRARAAEVTDDSLPEQVQKIRERFAPYSVHVSKSIEAEIEHLSTALTKALYDIVGRWFSDTEADFPGRMPLEEHEEDLLRVRSFFQHTQPLFTCIARSDDCLSCSGLPAPKGIVQHALSKIDRASGAQIS